MAGLLWLNFSKQIQHVSDPRHEKLQSKWFANKKWKVLDNLNNWWYY